MRWLSVLWECATWFKRPQKSTYDKYLEHKRAIELQRIDGIFKVSVCKAATIDKGDKRHAQLRRLDEQYNLPPGTAQNFYAKVDLAGLEKR